ncbi:MAG: 1,4-alpha-glucan branching protein GlgB [Planctomycetes bacterium]|nr:1,4-alpha-glucan branching protein GlgB [Planctomycetota bacterium]
MVAHRTGVPLLAGAALEEARRLLHGQSADPHRVLGAHPVTRHGSRGVVVRTFHPDAASAECLLFEGSGGTQGQAIPMERVLDGGVFAVFLPDRQLPLSYRVRLHFADGNVWERDDPYRFLPTIGDLDLHLFNEGSHRRLWECMGAHPRRVDGVDGVAFAVWAPNAVRVSVVGDFCRWDGRLLPMRQMGVSGVFELFVPGLTPGWLYKYEIRTQSGPLRIKADPYAFCAEPPPGAASRVYASNYTWSDDAWMASRPNRDITREPLAAYEVHLGSWRRVPEDGHRPLTYREIAPPLVEHVKNLGFTHVELLPIAEHPFGGSWGYQVTGYYAPTARHGTPDDFRFFVDYCHRHGVGVILDWVPAHFPKDDFALRRFDGTALYEHEDPRLGEHPDWGTLIFNYGRNEVRNFLVANALFWLREYHVDGLRVDAVASMLYLDYSRREGEWYPNRYGGKENLEAIDLMRHVNEVVREDCPGCFTIAEESTGWTGVSRPAREGGLGFSLKWNMGWMHDTLLYFSRDPVHRRFHQDDLTFAMLYEHSERFINPLSHDEVVHGKRSLLEKMPGDYWQKFANLRVLLAYQFTRPGKKLLFMGSEFAPYSEWYYDASLDWHLLDDPLRQGLMRCCARLGHLYRESPCLWRGDAEGPGFSWIDCADREQSVLSYIRRHGDDLQVVVLNLTPVPRDGYRIGVPAAAAYAVRLNTDEAAFGGSGYSTAAGAAVEPLGMHGFPQSIRLSLPPLSALVLAPA